MEWLIWLRNLWSVFVAYLKWDSRWAFLSNGILLATLGYRPGLWSAWDIVVTCTKWPVFAIKASSSFKVASGLSDQSPPYVVIKFGGTAWSRQGLGGTIRLPPFHDCLDCAARDIQGLWNIFIPIPWSVPFHNLYPGGLLKVPFGWNFTVECTTEQRKPTRTADFILK